MFLIALALFLLWPLLELIAVVAVAREVGVGLTLLALVLVSVLGAIVFKRSGIAVWRRATTQLAAGRSPTKQVLDGALVVVGGTAMLLPGFVSGALGALVLLPPVRAVLRPVLLSWMTARAARAARSGRFSGVVMDTVVEPDGQVRRRTRSFGDVLDTEGWEVGAEGGELPPGVIDVDGRPEREP